MATIEVFRLLNGDQLVTFNDSNKPDGAEKVKKALGLDIGWSVTLNGRHYRIVGVEDKAMTPNEASGLKDTVWKREFTVEPV